MLFPIKSHLLKAYRSRLERGASVENETSSTVENDSSLMSSYEVLCVWGRKCLMAGICLAVIGVLEGKKSPSIYYRIFCPAT